MLHLSWIDMVARSKSNRCIRKAFVVDVVLFLIFQNGEGRKKPLLAFRSLRGLLDPLFFFVEGILGWRQPGAKLVSK